MDEYNRLSTENENCHCRGVATEGVEVKEENINVSIMSL